MASSIRIRSGVARMTFRPGEMTIVDVETTLFPRVNLEHVGLGGMSSTFLFGPNDKRGTDDARPAVYRSGGLQMLNGQGEWLWRPLHNPETLQISAFVDTSPKGFGLIQRGVPMTRSGRRPALRAPAEPLDRAVGRLGTRDRAIARDPERCRDQRQHPRLLASKAPMAAGSEVALAYRQYWCWTPPDRPPLATVASDPGRARLHKAAAPLSSISRAKCWVTIRLRTINRPSPLVLGPFIISGFHPILNAGPHALPSSLTLATRTRVRCVSSSKRAGSRSAKHGSYRWTP